MRQLPGRNRRAASIFSGAEPLKKRQAGRHGAGTRSTEQRLSEGEK
jgi:hypothetical protein